MSVELDLTVHATEMIELSVIGELREVARSVDSNSVPHAESVSGQFRAIEVSEGHSFASDQQLAFAFGSAELVVFINNVDLCVGVGNADQDSSFGGCDLC